MVNKEILDRSEVFSLFNTYANKALDQKSFDHKVMHLLYEFAKDKKPFVAPNPAVSCIIVDKNRAIVGFGTHAFPGEAHAEVLAVQMVKDNYPDNYSEILAESTVYVSLEPCSHFGRTPPCASMLVRNNIKRLVYAQRDFTKKVNGKGISILEESGCLVEHYPLRKLNNLNLDFFYCNNPDNQLPFIRIKIGTSLDSKVALTNGESKWITNSSSRSYVQALRSKVGAIICSSQTIVVDNASYNVRFEELPPGIKNYQTPSETIQPQVIIIDNNFKLHRELNFFKVRDEEQLKKVTILSLHKHPLANTELKDKVTFIDNFDSYNIEHWIQFLVTIKQERKIQDILIESGANLVRFFIDNNLFHEVHCFQAPKILGKGKEAFMTDKEHQLLAECLNLTMLYSLELEDNIYSCYSNLAS